jgi:hypothetical protein
MAIWRLARASYRIHKLAKDLDEGTVSKTPCSVPGTTPLTRTAWTAIYVSNLENSA